MGFMGASNLLVELSTLQNAHFFVKLRVSEAVYLIFQVEIEGVWFNCITNASGSVVNQFPATKQLLSKNPLANTPHKRYSSLKISCPRFFLPNKLSVSFWGDCVFARSWVSHVWKSHSARHSLTISRKKSQMQQVGGYIS